MEWTKAIYEMWDEIFPGVTLGEFIHTGKDHASSICWLCQYKKLRISEDAWQAIKNKVDRNVWANGYRYSRQFVR